MHVAVFDVFNDGTGGQPVLGKTNPSFFEIGANLFMLNPIKTILLEQRGK